MLECYHPSAQYSAPWLLCDYLGSDYLGSDDLDDLDDLDQNTRSLCEGNGLDQFRDFRRRYLQFWPRRREHSPPGDSHASNNPFVRDGTHGKITCKAPASALGVTNLVNLDTHELFSQLCVRTDLVTLGPREGLFSSIIDLSEKITLRLWRKWLDERAEASTTDRSFRGLDRPQEDKIIWLDDDKKDVGIQVRVFERSCRRPMPILYSRDEDPPVSFDLQLDREFISRLRVACIIKLK